jgi:hypothetical protein
MSERRAPTRPAVHGDVMVADHRIDDVWCEFNTWAGASERL